MNTKLPPSWILRSTKEKDSDTGVPLYWSNDDGWVDKASATRFTDKERRTTPTIPLDSKWVKAPRRFLVKLHSECGCHEADHFLLISKNKEPSDKALMQIARYFYSDNGGCLDDFGTTWVFELSMTTVVRVSVRGCTEVSADEEVVIKKFLRL